jgi:hypothetical protein
LTVQTCELLWLGSGTSGYYPAQKLKMPKVTMHAGDRDDALGKVTSVDETCPICGGDDIGCLYGDWYLGDDESAGDTASAA